MNSCRPALYTDTNGTLMQNLEEYLITKCLHVRIYSVSRFHACHLHRYIIWAPSSEFLSSSILSWQILTAHAQPFRGARDLAFCLNVPLDSLLVRASSGSSGETARMRMLAWTFAARIGDKYQIRLTRSILSLSIRLPKPKGIASVYFRFAYIAVYFNTDRFHDSNMCCL